MYQYRGSNLLGSYIAKHSSKSPSSYKFPRVRPNQIRFYRKFNLDRLMLSIVNRMLKQDKHKSYASHGNAYLPGTFPMNRSLKLIDILKWHYLNGFIFLQFSNFKTIDYEIFSHRSWWTNAKVIVDFAHFDDWFTSISNKSRVQVETFRFRNFESDKKCKCIKWRLMDF